MSDKNIDIKISADISEFEKAVQKAMKTSEKLQKNSVAFDKKAEDTQKKQKKASADIGKSQGGFLRDQIKLQKEYNKALDDTLKKQKNLNKWKKGGDLGGKDKWPGGNDPRDPKKGKSGSPLGKAGAVAAGAAATGVGALIGLMTSQITDAYASYMQYGKIASGLIGTGATTKGFQGTLNKGIGLGYGPMETAAMGRSAARATGTTGTVTAAQQLSRASTMEVGEATEFMGVLRRAGGGFGGNAGTRGKEELRKTLAAGFASGIERARLPEYMQGVSALVEKQGGRSAGDVGTRDVTALLTMLGRSGKSGLQGSRGAAVLNALDDTIRNPGGGEAGQALLLQSMGFGKPGGKSSYYDALKSQQKGLTGSGGAENLFRLFQETKQQYGGGEEQILALQELTGGKLSIEQLEAIREVVEGNKSNAEVMKQISKITEKSKSLEEQALDEMKKGFGAVVERSAMLEKRLVDKGATIAGSVQSIQNTINSVVDTLWPAAVASLKFIAETIKNIWDFMRSTFGKSAGALSSDTKGIKGKFDKLTADYESGKLSKSEYTSQLEDLAKQAKDVQSQIANPGGGRKWMEGLGEAGAATMSLFGKNIKTDASLRDQAHRQMGVLRESIGEQIFAMKAGGKTVGQLRMDAERGRQQKSFEKTVSEAKTQATVPTPAQGSEPLRIMVEPSSEMKRTVTSTGNVAAARHIPATADPRSSSRFGGI